MLLDGIKALGYKYSTKAGITVGIEMCIRDRGCIRIIDQGLCHVFYKFFHGSLPFVLLIR